ncbi:glycine zipper 2TM domain-containing protein, partial [Candidatus Sumerlaeota bacterium]|nr:glycine zipper 2TM domain-containing protein [Candidatus Sumerlaeota bacterium]
MNRFYKVTSLSLIAALGAGSMGCETMNEHRTATGAVAGTLIGAAAGAAIDSHNRGRGALIGAAAGAAVGTGVGYMLQKQKQAFDRIKDLESQERTVI